MRYIVKATVTSTIEDMVDAENEKRAFEIVKNNFTNGEYSNKKRGEHISDHKVEESK